MEIVTLFIGCVYFLFGCHVFVMSFKDLEEGMGAVWWVGVFVAAFLFAISLSAFYSLVRG